MKETSLKKQGKYICYNTAGWHLPDIYALALGDRAYISGKPLLAVLSYIHVLVVLQFCKSKMHQLLFFWILKNLYTGVLKYKKE